MILLSSEICLEIKVCAQRATWSAEVLPGLPVWCVSHIDVSCREEMAQRQDRLDLPPLSQLIGTRINLQPGGVTLQDLNPVFPDAHAQPDRFQQPDYQFSAWRPDCFPAPHPSGSSRPQLDNTPWEQQRFLTAQPGPSLEASALNIHDFDLSHLSCFNNESYLPELRTNLDAARPGPISQAARTDRLSLSEDLDAEPSLLQDLSFSESMEASNRGLPLDAPGASGPCSTEPSAQTSRGTTRYTSWFAQKNSLSSRSIASRSLCCQV